MNGAFGKAFVPRGVALLPGGDVLVSDASHRVRVCGLRDGGALNDWAGGPWDQRVADGSPARLSLTATSPRVSELHDGGGLAWYELNPISVRLLTPDGRVVTLVGSDGGSVDGTFATASIGVPRDITTGPDGRIWVVDGTAVRAIDVNAGTVTTLAGDGGMLGSLTAPLALAVGKGPGGVDDVLYVADGRAPNATVKRYVLPNGPGTSFPNDAGENVTAMLADGDGGLYLASNGSGSTPVNHVAFMGWSGAIDQFRFAAATSIVEPRRWRSTATTASSTRRTSRSTASRWTPARPMAAWPDRRSTSPRRSRASPTAPRPTGCCTE